MSFGKQLLLFALAAPPDPAGEAAGDECATGAARAAPAMPCAGAVSAVVAAGAAVLAPGTAIPRPARAGFSATAAQFEFPICQLCNRAVLRPAGGPAAAADSL